MEFAKEKCEDLKRAVNDVISGRMSYRKAALHHRINRGKLFHHVKNSQSTEKPGPREIFSEEEQNELKSYLSECLKKGWPRRLKDLTDAAHFLLKKRLGESCKKPSDTWGRRFLQRNNLSLRKPENISRSSSNLTKENICNWSNDVRHSLESQNLQHLLSDPSRIFNADETFMLLNPTRGNVIAPVGHKYVYETAAGNEKEGITAMCGFSADGKALKPFLIFSYARIPKALRDSFPYEKATLDASKNGWMDSQRCTNYLKAVSEEIKSRGINLPTEKVLMFWDRHSSHLTLEVCQTAADLGIVLIALYPNSTFLTQPCDVAIFRSLKSHWNDVVREDKFNDVCKNITKQEFPRVFLRAFERITAETVSSGFRATGIFPWNSDAIDFRKCIGGTQEKEAESNNEAVIVENAGENSCCGALTLEK